MCRVLALLAVLIAATANAGALDNLRKQPATKYDLGKFKLEVQAFVVYAQLKDQAIGRSGFRMNAMGVTEQGGKLLVVASLIGPARYVNSENCVEAKRAIVDIFPVDALAEDLWSGLTDEEYKSLQSELGISVVLVSSENAEFTKEC